MTSLRVAAVQANYVLMDRAATLERVAALTAGLPRRAPSGGLPRGLRPGHADLDPHPADLGW